MKEVNFAHTMPGDNLTQAWFTVTSSLGRGLIVEVNGRRISRPHARWYHVMDHLSPRHRRMMSVLGLRAWLRSLLLSGDGVIRIVLYERMEETSHAH